MNMNGWLHEHEHDLLWVCPGVVGSGTGGTTQGGCMVEGRCEGRCGGGAGVSTFMCVCLFVFVAGRCCV